MRHVPYDPKKIKYPDGWDKKAADALRAVKDAPADEKADEVNKHRDVWASLKSELAKVMNGKCWYTEAPQAGTDTDVDHFRPKNAVKDVVNPVDNSPHPGYWWKAFDPANYRYSCIVANRPRRDEKGVLGGKVAAFPLWDESKRVWDCSFSQDITTQIWSYQDECDQEQPLLLDPCISADVALIMFAEDGEAKPRHRQADKPRLHERAKQSIEIYHINHPDFIKARIKLREEVEKHVEAAQRFYKKLDQDDADNEYAYSCAIEELRAARDMMAPYSRFVIDILEPYRADESLSAVFLA